METVGENPLTPDQVQALHHIGIMMLQSKPNSTINAAWNTLVEDAIGGATPERRLETFAGIWTGFQDQLDSLQIQASDEVQFYHSKANFYETLRKQTLADLAKTRQLFQDQMKVLEEQLNQVGDDAQLANVDLQNALQKQQQTLQTMSTISKLLHDTAMAVIRKIGG